MTTYIQINGLEKYTISDCGKIKNKHGKTLKPFITKDGVEQVSLSDNNNSIKKYLTHMLVYKSFIGNVKNGTYVKHIDGNKLNNNVQNLVLANIKDIIKREVTQVDFVNKLKICSRCKIQKSFNEFTKQKDKTGGLSIACKTCEKTRRQISENIEKSKIRNNNYRVKNLEKLKNNSLEYYKENREVLLKSKKEYYNLNKAKLCKMQSDYYLKNKDARNQYNKSYTKANKSKLNSISNARKRNKRQIDSRYKLYCNISSSIAQALRGNKNFKKWADMVPYSTNELRANLESKFTQGMSWDNYGKDGWHVDHIIPQCYFKYISYKDRAFQACWALSNLQPLWATKQIAISYGESVEYIGNLDKNNKIVITSEIQEFLNLVNLKEENAEAPN